MAVRSLSNVNVHIRGDESILTRAPWHEPSFDLDLRSTPLPISTMKRHRRTSVGQLKNVSTFKNSRLFTLLWKLGALSGNGLNNATQFILSFSREDIVVPAVNRCGIGRVLRGGGNVLWGDQSCLRNGVEAEFGPESADTVQDG
jgi:hypothetical protein